MQKLYQQWRDSPIALRVVPFILFVLPLYLQGKLGAESPFWIYALRTLLGIGLIGLMLPWVQEMRWSFSWEAVAVGIGIFIIWVALDPWTPWFGSQPEPEWNPHSVFGDNTVWAWCFILVRIFGSTFVVPPLEEVFYRSFFYRYLIQADFLGVSLGRFQARAFLVTALVFGLAHEGDWLAGVLCGAAYQALALRRGRLGDAMTAHAVTNFLLGLWVIGRGAWQFW